MDFFKQAGRTLLLLLGLCGAPLRAQEWLNLQKKDGLLDNHINKLFVFKDELWIGTPSGAAVYSLKEKKWDRKIGREVLPDLFVNDILVDNRYIWIATIRGLARYDKADKKWTVYTKSTGLSEDHVSCIFADRENYWFGTRYWGVSSFSKLDRSWRVFTALDGLAGNRVTSAAGTGDEVWFGAREGLSRLRTYEAVWNVFTAANTGYGLSGDQILSLVVDRDDVWCGTEGQGISRYNPYLEKWQQFTMENSLLDDFINTLVLDGESIWAGTFSGVSHYNRNRNAWRNFGERKELPDLYITAMAVDGDYIWFGSSSGGITRFRKSVPQVFVNHGLTGYAGKNLIHIYGTVLDYDGIGKISVSFRKRDRTQWFTSGIRIVKEGNFSDELMARWETGSLEDGEYVLKIEAYDKKGQFNSAETLLKIDSIRPVLYLDRVSSYVRADRMNITGTYFEENLVKISLAPAGPLAVVDKLLKTFALPVRLNEGVNRFDVIAEDMARQSTAVQAVLVRDTRSPRIAWKDGQTAFASNALFTLEGAYNEENVDSVTILPYNEKAEIDYHKRTFRKTVSLKEGKNTVTALIRDKAQNEASVSRVIEYAPLRDPVLFHDAAPFVGRSEIRLTGEVLLRNFLSAEAQLNQRKIPLNLDPDRKGFTLNLKLKQGKNYLSMDFLDSDKKPKIAAREIISDTAPPGIQLIDFPAYTPSRAFRIRGRMLEDYPAHISLAEFPNILLPVEGTAGEFSFDLEVPGEGTPLTFHLRDKAGNRSVFKTNIVFDPDPPALLSLEYPRFSNRDEVLLKGRFRERNPEKPFMEKGALLESTGNSFTFSLPVREGENGFTLLLRDKAGFSLQTNITVMGDRTAPEFSAPALPETVNTNRLDLTGRLKSRDIAGAAGYPGPVELTLSDGRFFGTVSLLKGMNLVRVVVRDHAGNLSVFSQSVMCRSGETGKNLVTLTAEEYRRLLEKEGPVRTKITETGFKREPLPDSSSLVLTPYYVSRGDTLWLLARDYYGSLIYADHIQNLNGLIDPNLIRSRESIFMPTRKLIRSLVETGDALYSQILSLVLFIRYNYGFFSDMRSYNAFLEKLFAGYGIPFRRVASNYNRSVFLVQDTHLLVFSRFAMDLNAIKDLTPENKSGKFNLIRLENDENKISCDFRRDYPVR